MIPLVVPNLNGNEKKYLDNCIDTTFVSSVGEYVTRFETMVAEAAGAKDAVATSAGTTGLHAALTAAGVRNGDLVIIPAFTFIASANAAAHCGAIPWCMDISGTDWCLNPDLVKHELKTECERQEKGLIHKASGRRVAALMPVYTLGNIPDMETFREIANEYSLPLIVDAACAIGASFHGKKMGELADLSVFSFNGNKTVTCGGGGAVIGNNKELTSLVRHLTTTARVWPDYDFDMPGFNYRMTNIQAAVGCAQMERLDVFIAAKRRIRAFYRNALENLTEKGVEFFPETDGASCWFSGIVLPEGKRLADAKEICSKLKNEQIETRTFWKPVHLQKAYQNALSGQVLEADKLWERIITLPCSTGITDEQLETVAEEVKKIVCAVL